MNNIEFTITNSMGLTIHEIYVAPSVDEDWGSDCLDSETVIEDGEGCHIELETEETVELWDIRIIDAEENEYVFEQVDLSEIEEMELYFDEDGEPVFSY